MNKYQSTYLEVPAHEDSVRDQTGNDFLRRWYHLSCLFDDYNTRNNYYRRQSVFDQDSTDVKNQHTEDGIQWLVVTVHFTHATFSHNGDVSFPDNGDMFAKYTDGY